MFEDCLSNLEMIIELIYLLKCIYIRDLFKKIYLFVNRMKNFVDNHDYFRRKISKILC